MKKILWLSLLSLCIEDSCGMCIHYSGKGDFEERHSSKVIKKPILKHKCSRIGSKYLDQDCFNKLNSFINNHFYVTFSPYVNVVLMNDSLMRRVKLPDEIYYKEIQHLAWPPFRNPRERESNNIFVRKCSKPVRTTDRCALQEGGMESYGSLPIIGDSIYEGNFELFEFEEERPSFVKNYRIWYSVKVNKVNKELKGPVKDFFRGKSLILEGILSSLIKKDIYSRYIYSDETGEAYNKYYEVCKSFWDGLHCNNVIQKDGLSSLPDDFKLNFYIHNTVLIK